MRKFKAASIFSSNMVLQREKNIAVFGYGENGKKVTVNFCEVTKIAEVKYGQWKVCLPALKAGGPYQMTISCENETYTFDNVMIGEVWLAGGQSNMEFELQNCTGGMEHLKNDKGVNVRFYYTQKKCYMDEEFFNSEEKMIWKEFDEEAAKCWSAVGYFFAKELSEKLGVTVGIIGCNWGGTSASHWMSRTALADDIDTRLYIDEYDKAIAGKSEEQLLKEYRDYEAYHEEWNRKSAEYYSTTENATWGGCLRYCGPCKYPGPLCPANPFHPTGLYESMIKRVCPYTLKGFIYYQGESDDHRPDTYYKLFRSLIGNWRSDWGDNSLPFIFAQLPMHRYEADEDRKHWCVIREAQMNIYETIKNTGVAVIIDCGEFNEIHPKDKLPVGHRMYLQAMKHFYGEEDTDAFGPLYNYATENGNEMTIAFKYADKGFTVKGEEVTGFEVAGEDKIFHKAEAVINSDNTITVKSEKVSVPVYVRYLWTNYSEVTLFGANGLPVAPFRTSKQDN